MDDVRVGRIVRQVRRRRGWRQVDLAAAAGVSQAVVSRAERGHIASLTFAVARRIMAVLEIRAEWQISWRGGAIDRLLDELHASIGAVVAGELASLGWSVLPEVTFMRLGERGSMDLLGVDAARRAAVVIELKSELTSYEQTQRRLDAKVRVAAGVIEERVGWRPIHLGVVLVLADTRSNRDRAKRVAPLLRAALPAGTVAVKRWLRDLSGLLAGVWFVQGIHDRTSSRGRGGAHRVRLPAARSGRARRDHEGTR